MQDFRDCITNSGLGHINTVGSLYTWTNKRPNDPIQKRLDQMLENKEWLSTFTESIVLVKSRGLMDHHPLLLSVPMQVERFIKPFQFFNYMTNLKNSGRR